MTGFIQFVLTAILVLLIWILIVPSSAHTAIRKFVYTQIGRIKISRSGLQRPKSDKAEGSAELLARVARLEEELRAKEGPPARPKA